MQSASHTGDDDKDAASGGTIQALSFRRQEGVPIAHLKTLIVTLCVGLAYVYSHLEQCGWIRGCKLGIARFILGG